MNKSWKTAISRKSLSAPAKWLKDNGLLVGRCLDYGCGRGFDCDKLGIAGWDPYWRPKKVAGKFDTIICNYVLNVLETWEQQKVLDEIRSLLKENGNAYVSVRTDHKNLKGWTKNGTYQCEVLRMDLAVKHEGRGFRVYWL